MRPIVALLTDFGNRDHYAGAVRGAVLAACPEATVVDVTHEIPPHDVAEAAWTLLAALRAFPAGSVFAAIVDPEPGSGRRSLAVEAGGYRLVGPDNGVLGLVLAEYPGARVHEITNRGLFRHEVSETFHGRDVFAPVAGHLAAGAPLDEVGPPVSDPTLRELPVPRQLDGVWEAEVVHVDRFGNLTTSFARSDVEAMLAGVGGDTTDVVALVGGVVMPLVRTYGEVSEGEPCALIGSSGRLQVTVSRGDAAVTLGAGLGEPVRLRRAAPGRPE
jgi:hypothetical protein